MSDATVRSPREFIQRLEEGDRWIEMVNGRLIRLSPPDERHGNVVRNLSQALSRYFRESKKYFAAYELALLVSPATNTIRTPAISCFLTAEGLEPLDELLCERVPQLVVEIASSNDRRESMTERIRGYQVWGVNHIWVFDPQSLHVHVFSPHETPRMLKEIETLTARTLFPGFEILVGDVFADPEWARR